MIGWSVKELADWLVDSLNDSFNTYLLSTICQALSQVLACDGQPKLTQIKNDPTSWDKTHHLLLWSLNHLAENK